MSAVNRITSVRSRGNVVVVEIKLLGFDGLQSICLKPSDAEIWANEMLAAARACKRASLEADKTSIERQMQQLQERLNDIVAQLSGDDTPTSSIHAVTIKDGWLGSLAPRLYEHVGDILAEVTDR